MKSVQFVGAVMAPPLTPQALRTTLLARRISASGPLAIALTEMVFGEVHRDDHNLLVGLIAERVGASAGAR